MTVEELLALLKGADPKDPVFMETSNGWVDAHARFGACRIEDAEGEMGYVHGLLIAATPPDE